MTVPDISFYSLQEENRRLRRLMAEAGIDARLSTIARFESAEAHRQETSLSRNEAALAREQGRAAALRADQAEAQSAEWRDQNAKLLIDTNFMAEVLESSTDCITVLDLDGRLVFMSAGGMRVMEIDRFEDHATCPWLSFWGGPYAADAEAAVHSAKGGQRARFQGVASTAKGTERWWDVVVTPMLDDAGEPKSLLAISRDITQLKEAEEHQLLLMHELHHRVKNMLATVSAITAQSLRVAATTDEGRQAIEARLKALGAAHDLLMREGVAGANLQRLICGAIEPFDRDDSSRFEIDSCEVAVGSMAGLPLAMVINELCTNAVKYGALSNDTGRIHISCKVSEGANRLTLTWRETGGPPVVEPTQKSFGTRLIEQSLSHRLQGETRLAFEPEGVVYELSLPLSVLHADMKNAP